MLTTKEKIYTVSFLPGEGSGAIDPVNVVEGMEFIIPGNDGLHPPEGKYFTGWKDQNSTTYAVGFVLTVENNIALTAQWNDIVSLGLVIASLPYKTSYAIGEMADWTGLRVVKKLSDGTEEEISDYTVSEIDPWRLGTQTISVTTGEGNITFDITIDQPHILPVMRIDTSGKPVDSKEIWISNAGYTIENAEGTILASGKTDIKGRGNSSWSDTPKKSYAIKFENGRSVLGMPYHKRWNLIPNYQDKTMVRNELAFKIGKILDYMAWTPRSEQVLLFLNNEYLGLYQITEAIKIDENRVDVDEIKVNNTDGGYVLEIDNHWKGEAFGFSTNHDGIYFSCSDPDSGLDVKVPSLGKTLLQVIKANTQEAENVLYSNEWLDENTGYRHYFDVPSFIDWWLAEELVKDFEINLLNGRYVYYDGQKIYAGPLWDMDLTFGYLWWWGGSNAEDFTTIGNDIPGPSWWIDRMFEDPDFVSQVKARWNEKYPGLNTTLQQYINSRKAVLAPSIALDYRRWDLDTNIDTEYDYLKTWLAARIEWLNGAINLLN
jgi:hypothetical protein